MERQAAQTKMRACACVESCLWMTCKSVLFFFSVGENVNSMENKHFLKTEHSCLCQVYMSGHSVIGSPWHYVFMCLYLLPYFNKSSYETHFFFLSFCSFLFLMCTEKQTKTIKTAAMVNKQINKNGTIHKKSFNFIPQYT